MKCKACKEEFEKKWKDQVYCNKLCAFHKKPFRAWDGEGITPDPNIKRHLYILLATDDAHIYNPEGIKTKEAFAFLTEKREKCINIWFAFDYDINCILRDIPLRGEISLETLAKTGELKWHGWGIRYIPGKVFSIRRGRRRFTSYDCFGYFQKAFVKALKSNGLDPSAIEVGKAERSNFAKWKLEDIIAYNQHELDLLIDLMSNKIRKSLGRNAPSSQWYGPGAVASEWLEKTCKIKMEEHRTWPKEMEVAIMHSYFGGRIDVAQIGEFKNCYSYDIASAYPYAMTMIPRVKEWRHIEYNETSRINARRDNGRITTTSEPMEIDYFGLYRIAWKVPKTSRWCPFPFRDKKGRILYPPMGEGWYFGCEIISARKLFATGITIREGWIPVRDGLEGTNLYPLRAPILAAYTKRMECVRNKDAGELSYKLILNSMYGKFGQKQTRRSEFPRWQNYIWAGFSTALTRSMILDVIAKDPNAVIAVATDSVFCTAPILGVAIKEKYDVALGEWTYERNLPTLVCMPGVYARFDGDQALKYRQRGFNMPMNYGTLLRKWGCQTDYNTPGIEDGEVKFTRFVTFRTALANNRSEWCFFQEESKALADVSMTGFSKRFPSALDIYLWEWKTKDMWATPIKQSEPMSRMYRLPTFEEEVEHEEPILL